MLHIVNGDNKLQDKILQTIISLFLLAISSHATDPHWVFFTDKGFARDTQVEKVQLAYAKKRLSQRCLERRAKARPNVLLVDFADIDVEKRYVDELHMLGAEVRIISRWLNAVSVEAEPDVLSEIAEQSFVADIRPVTSFRRGETIEHTDALPTDSLYGGSRFQNSMLDVPLVHNAGIDGNGVLICMTDTGFDFDHECFDFTNILAAYDFLDDDSVVSYESGNPIYTESHGTATWSVVAGYAPGKLIGTAYGASYLLARTEHYSMEDPIEEDYWIAAAEWADSAGADIISSSLGYTDWYTPDSMTGDVARITIAADRMSGLGICVVVSAGNSGSAGPISIAAPADGDSVIAVGAANADGEIIGFSSQGPTFDGRTKPELVALGENVRCASYANPTAYTTGAGTSISAPLVAGCAALLLQARPQLLPMDIREALMQTASNRQNPNNRAGWGIPDVYAALSYPIDGQLLLPVFRGWNLLSLPLSDTINVDSVFAGRTGDVWVWDNDSEAYIESELIKPGNAYFVLYPQDTLLEVRGDPLTSITIPTTTGWHAVGGVKGSSSFDSIAENSSAGLHTGLFLYDPVDKRYITSKMLPPGRGAFILVAVPGEIVILD